MGPSQKLPDQDPEGEGTGNHGRGEGPEECSPGESPEYAFLMSLGSEIERTEVVRLLDTSKRLSQNTTYPIPFDSEERVFLDLFATQISQKRIDSRQHALTLLVNSPDATPLRRDFLEQVATIALRCAARGSEPPGCVPALRLVFQHHAMASVVVHRVFAKSVMPDNRCGIARVVGELDLNLQRELFESVFDTFVAESEAFRSGMRSAEGIAMCALQSHDSLRLLQRVELLFDRGTPAYEAALSPLRQQVGRDLEVLVARDKGSTAVEVLKRCLPNPLSFEEQAAVVEPMITCIGSNKVSPEAVVAFLAIPGVRGWLGSDRVHSELLSRPRFLNQPVVHEVLRAAIHESADADRSPDAVRALLRMARYLGRIEGGASSQMLWSEELESLTLEVLRGGVSDVSVYREMMSAISLRAKGCSIAMQSIFRHVAAGDIPPEAVAPLLGVIRDAVVRFPEIVLGEAGRFSEPERSFRWVVDSLVTSGEGTDTRARDIVAHWSLLLQDGSADMLFWGAPLSPGQLQRATKALGQAIAAARVF